MAKMDLIKVAYCIGARDELTGKTFCP